MENISTLGWIGLGDIGRPMALQLIGAGHRVIVWARDPAKTKAAQEAGATVARSAAELASQCDGVFLCVTDGDAVEDVVFGPKGVAEGARRGSIIIDHSTIHPETARLAARRLHGNGIAWVDAPVSGGAVGAKAGTLSVFVGAENTDLARVKPWLSAYAKNVTHMGRVGNGQLAKSCNQAVVASSIALWAEVIAYARRCELDPDLLVDALAGGWADSEIRRVHGHDMAAGRFRRTPGFILLKDLDIIGDVARSAKAPMPLTSAATTLYRLLLAQGLPPGGPGALMQLYEEPSTS